MTPTRSKILFLITKSTLGGAQRYVYDLALNLDTERFDPIVIAGGDGPLIDMLKEKGLKVYSLKDLKRDVSIWSDLRAIFSLFRIVRAERPAVLHINSSKAGLFGSIVGRICGVPKIIFTAHGWAFNEDRSALQKKILKVLHWLTILFSHKTIAVSNVTKAQMDWIWTKDKMTVIHIGRDSAPLVSKDDARGILEMKVIDPTARLIDYHDDLWIGTIAELHPTKRLNRAIDAVNALAHEHPNVRFIIIHDGQEKERLQAQVRDLGMEEHVFFTGTIPDAARLLPAFDLFVLPSKSEAFPYVIIEAGHAGLPVVATRVGGIPDIITDNENGLLVPPEDTPALTRAMRFMLEDPQLRERLARAHHEKTASFNLEKMVSETEALYRAD
jgi:glycosyltransferase involved in cell wall biosynthesis